MAVTASEARAICENIFPQFNDSQVSDHDHRHLLDDLAHFGICSRDQLSDLVHRHRQAVEVRADVPGDSEIEQVCSGGSPLRA